MLSIEITTAELAAVLIYMVILTVIDIKTMHLPVRYLIIGGAVLMLIKAIIGRCSIRYLLSGVIVGLFFLIISKVSKEKIGYGDSLIILILAMFTNGIIVMTAVMLGCFIIAMYSLTFLISGKAAANKRVPFVPFLSIGFLISVYMW